MPHLRLSQWAAVAFLVVAQFIPGYSQYPQVVTNINSLAKAANEIQNSLDQGIHYVRFDSYGDVGTFKIDSPPSNVQSLIFERNHSDSEGVIKVTGTLLDIKNMKSKVTLKGLAFQLMPNAVLLAGADGTKVNGSLLIDSCFIFADTLDNTFLSWVGDNLSSVEIRHSFIVIGGSRNAMAKISLSGGSLRLNNNLINFSGTLASPGVFQQAEFISNTINRTQFQLTGLLNAGALPRLEFANNLIAHKGAKDAFGGNIFYVLNHSNFQSGRVVIQSNKMFNTWTGFDYPSNDIFKNTNNTSIDTIPGKASTEKWNWYTETLDGNETGLLSGAVKQIEKYNVMPPDSTYGWSLPGKNLTVSFQSALYPRMIVLDTPNTKLAQPLDSAFHRRIFPSAGYAHFGPFRIKSITLGAAADFGKPVLLAADSLNMLRAQASTSLANTNPSFYANNLGKARNFVLVNVGNTPKGNDIRIGLGEGSTVKATDRLVIAKVDSAGESTVNSISPGPGALATDLRSLGVGYLVKSSAVASSLFHIGAKEETRPYSPDKVFWLFKNGSDTLVLANKALPVSDTDRYTASANYSSAKGDLSAYLVEKLSIPPGGKTIVLSNGSANVESISGFQLTVDSSHVVDPESYGTPTKGYSFTWPVKSNSDSIKLSLRVDSSHVMFVRLANGTTERLTGDGRIGGNLIYKIKDVDTGKVFFAAMEYNIKKAQFYNNVTYDGVTLTGFRSAKSGKLGFEGLSSDFQKSLGDAVKDFRLLGGTQMKAVSIATLSPDTTYRIEFTLSKNALNPAMVVTYFYNGLSWSIVPVSGRPVDGRYLITQVPAAAQAIALVERLEAAEKYVTADTSVVGQTLTIKTNYAIDSITHITHYCVELQWVNEVGNVEPDLCQNTDKKVIGQTTFISLVENSAYQIRILYYIGDEEIKGRNFGLVPGTSFSAMKAAENVDVKIRAKKRWHLVGFPVSGPFTKFMDRSKVPEEKTDLDQTLVMRFRKHNQGDASKAVFDTLADWSTRLVKPGDAYLLASSRPFVTTVTAADTALPLKPHTLVLDTGWILVANPFPIPQVRSKIAFSGLNDRSFYRLDTIAKANGPREYTWTPDTVLRPFVGYAYYAVQNEALTFNPLAGAAAKTGQGSGQAEDFEARLEAPWGLSAMTVTAMSKRTNIPFLPVPGNGLQLRVGGGNGFMVKAIADADRIDEPVEIRSPESGLASFTFRRPFRTGMSMRLVDVETGAVHDEAGSRSLPISEGSHAYRLIAGDEAFVQARTQAFLAAAPAEISMSQNYPNPFRGRTNVELRWPAWQGGARTAMLDVVDMHGRLLQRIDLGAVRVGKQVVALDASDWRTGVYIYRLTVATGGRRIQIQKRMLVTP